MTFAFHEFTDPVPVITPQGRGCAIFVSSSGHDHYWTVVLDHIISNTKWPASGCPGVTFRQSEILFARSYTLGLGMSDADMRAILGVVEEVLAT